MTPEIMAEIFCFLVGIGLGVFLLHAIQDARRKAKLAGGWTK